MAGPAAEPEALGLPGILAAQTTNVLINGDFEDEPNWALGIDTDGSYTEMIEAQIPGWTIEPGHAAKGVGSGIQTLP